MKRYIEDYGGDWSEDEDGEWCKFSDVEALEKERDELIEQNKAIAALECDAQKRKCELRAERDTLRAENEKLRERVKVFEEGAFRFSTELIWLSELGHESLMDNEKEDCATLTTQWEACDWIGRIAEIGRTEKEDEEDICGLCGEPGANKIPHPERWPGERKPDTDLVHDECEKAECVRAHAALSDEQRKEYLRGLR
jgi:FtsZ-binding cell division protein ZapB